jgi:hypothetical protein
MSLRYDSRFAPYNASIDKIMWIQIESESQHCQTNNKFN